MSAPLPPGLVSRLVLATLPLSAAVLRRGPPALLTLSKAVLRPLLAGIWPQQLPFGRTVRRVSAEGAAADSSGSDRQLLTSLPQLAVMLWPLLLYVLLHRATSRVCLRSSQGRRQPSSPSSGPLRRRRRAEVPCPLQQPQQSSDLICEHYDGAGASGGLRIALGVLRAAAVAHCLVVVAALTCGALGVEAPGCLLIHTAVQWHSLLLLQAVLVAAMALMRPNKGASRAALAAAPSTAPDLPTAVHALLGIGSAWLALRLALTATALAFAAVKPGWDIVPKTMQLSPPAAVTDGYGPLGALLQPLLPPGYGPGADLRVAAAGGILAVALHWVVLRAALAAALWGLLSTSGPKVQEVQAGVMLAAAAAPSSEARMLRHPPTAVIPPEVLPSVPPAERTAAGPPAGPLRIGKSRFSMSAPAFSTLSEDPKRPPSRQGGGHDQQELQPLQPPLAGLIRGSSAPVGRSISVGVADDAPERTFLVVSFDSSVEPTGEGQREGPEFASTRAWSQPARARGKARPQPQSAVMELLGGLIETTAAPSMLMLMEPPHGMSYERAVEVLTAGAAPAVEAIMNGRGVPQTAGGAAAVAEAPQGPVAAAVHPAVGGSGGASPSGGGSGGGTASADAVSGGRRFPSGRWLSYMTEVLCLRGCVELVLRLQYIRGELDDALLAAALAALKREMEQQLEEAAAAAEPTAEGAAAVAAAAPAFPSAPAGTSAATLSLMAPAGAAAAGGAAGGGGEAGEGGGALDVFSHELRGSPVTASSATAAASAVASAAPGAAARTEVPAAVATPDDAGNVATGISVSEPAARAVQLIALLEPPVVRLTAGRGGGGGGEDGGTDGAGGSDDEDFTAAAAGGTGDGFEADGGNDGVAGTSRQSGRGSLSTTARLHLYIRNGVDGDEAAAAAGGSGFAARTDVASLGTNATTDKATEMSATGAAAAVATRSSSSPLQPLQAPPSSVDVRVVVKQHGSMVAEVERLTVGYPKGASVSLDLSGLKEGDAVLVVLPCRQSPRQEEQSQAANTTSPLSGSVPHVPPLYLPIAVVPPAVAEELCGLMDKMEYEAAAARGPALLCELLSDTTRELLSQLLREGPTGGEEEEHPGPEEEEAQPRGAGADEEMAAAGSGHNRNNGGNEDQGESAAVGEDAGGGKGGIGSGGGVDGVVSGSEGPAGRLERFLRRGATPRHQRRVTALRAMLLGFSEPDMEEACTSFRCHHAQSWDLAVAVLNAVLAAVLMALTIGAGYGGGSGETVSWGPLGGGGGFLSRIWPPLPPWALVQLALCCGCLLLPPLVLEAWNGLYKPRLREPLLRAGHAVSLILLFAYVKWNGGPGEKMQLLRTGSALAALMVVTQPMSHSIHVRGSVGNWVVAAVVLALLFRAVTDGDAATVASAGTAPSSLSNNWAAWLPSAMVAASLVLTSVLLVAVRDVGWRMDFLGHGGREAEEHGETARRRWRELKGGEEEER
ncbi:hypothetical protein PLESTB_000861400 [Pleodorina starrii]|uniref:Uncharacterized protein n=1 Tax=Pleodorina starrii TaxID=330485 RepID=A0A9W6F2X1_9CHLO|nr:hypothetical protein PLESTB_000861400 [Pleodorina starrii]